MAPKNDRAAREAQIRLRRYIARQELHARLIKRRRRDDILAVVAVIVVTALAVGAQLTWQADAGRPAPAPSPSSSAERDS